MQATIAPEKEEKILILCRAIPEESTKYFQIVCVAGVTDQTEWRRLYPIPFKPFQRNGGIPFRKRDWIQAVTGPPEDGRDRRQESRKIRMDTVRLLGKMDSGQLHDFIRPLVFSSVGSIKNRDASLGLVKPIILDYQLDILSTSLMDRQLQLTPEGSLAPRSMIKLRQESRYIFVCEDQSECWCSNQPHKMRILDWEINELYRHVVQRTKDHTEIKAKMRAKMFDWMKNERMTYFLVGTHHRWQNWMVVSLLYFKKDINR